MNSSEKKAYRQSKKAAIDAVITSRARHLADNQYKNQNNSGDERSLYNQISKKLASEKVKNLEDMVANADKTNGVVSVDIRDDDKMFKNTKSITGDFADDGHMSLHTIRGESKILDQNRDGRMKSTGYGENDEFIRQNTKSTVKKLATDKFEKEKKKVGLREDLSYLFEDALFERVQTYEELTRNIRRRHPDWSKEQIHNAVTSIINRQKKQQNQTNNNPTPQREPEIKIKNGVKYIRVENGGFEIFDESYTTMQPVPIDKITLNSIADVVDNIKDIQYGFISKKDGCRIVNRDWIHNCPNLGEFYEVQTDPEITIKEKLGICTDQCLAIKHLFDKLHPECKTQMYALLKGRFGHCTIGFMTPDEKWYYLENAWDKERGLHGPFEKQNDLEKYLNYLYHKHHDKDNDDDVIVQTYEEYKGLNESINFLENNILYNCIKKGSENNMSDIEVMQIPGSLGNIITEMASLPGGINKKNFDDENSKNKVYVYAGEGPTDHCHVMINGKEICVRLSEHEYFLHGKHNDIFTRDERDLFYEYMLSKTEYGITRWETAVMFWNSNLCKGSVKIKKDIGCPNYKKLKV